MNSSIGDCVAFGPFRLFAAARILERDGVNLDLGSRALDILIALVERAGEIVKHRELIARVWRGLVVDTGNLRVQVTHLRKCLEDGRQGARYIANVPGQGYSFVAPIGAQPAGAYGTHAGRRPWRCPLRIPCPGDSAMGCVASISAASKTPHWS